MTEKPLELKFHEICIGQTNTFQIEITEKMVDDFANFSGDYNPLHMDKILQNQKILKIEFVMVCYYHHSFQD